MPRYMIRSTLYNLCFYSLTACACILCLPTLLMPRRAFMTVVHGFVFCNHILERYILALDFEVRGREYLPPGPCIIAAKHQSAYETTKLHILFDDPAIILKRELLKIPLWGRYLAKSDVIAIDRSTPKSAIESIQTGAKRVMEQGRQIVIFPQGTRVATHVTAKDRPYKIGVVRIQEATQLPIIPLAMNTGVFWPRNSWLKTPGRVVFEFLPPILPGDSPDKILANLQETLESRTDALMSEARAQIATRRKPRTPLIALILALILIIAYTANWFIVAEIIRTRIAERFDEAEREGIAKIVKRPVPVISGFPGKMNLDMGELEILSPAGTINLASLHAEAWPLPRMPIAAEIKQLEVKQRYWLAPLNFESVSATVRPRGQSYDLIASEALSGDFVARANGHAILESEDAPQIVLTLEVENEQPFIQKLVENQIVRPQPAMIAGSTLAAMKRDGVAKLTLTSRGQAVYLGPIKIMDLKRRRPIQ
ncbi:MAG: 1-acyl-sn-glycerol-3-phosphate acyltransferase [Alphaproteobacteria bacterium]|nr:1-acyl-sn-glycerol-3-phosphate acyltransferase [Alphaproteobacteria bacterium]